MHSKQKVAFIKWGGFSHVNTSVLEILASNFPDFQIDVIEVGGLMSELDPISLFYCIKDYGKDILFKNKTLSGSFVRTPYFFKRTKKAIQRRLADQQYAFTLQTQSLFDASVPSVPHFVYTDHTHLANLRYPGFSPHRLFAQSWIDCEKAIYQNATLVFTMSSNITKSVVEDYSCDPNKVVCVYCGANAQTTKDEIFFDSRFSKKNILFVGTEWERKGGPILVEAFRKLLVTHPDATLTIVGCSPVIDVPNCTVVGRIPLSDVKRYYRQASVFCLPTTLEPFGIVFLEAMAHKLPVIATNIGAIPDFVLEDKNGHLVEPNNSEQLFEKIARLISLPERCKAFGEFGHYLLWERYTWGKTGIRIRENIVHAVSRNNYEQGSA